jgi:hypothetical protein
MVEYNIWLGYLFDVLKWGIPPIMVALLENRYHIINRIRKAWAVYKNEGTEARMALEYITNVDFEKIKEEFKNTFRTKDGIDIKKTNSLSMSFTSGIFSINIIKTKMDTIFIEVERIGCGIKNLKERINDFLAKMNELSKKDVNGEKILSNFISCDLTFSLPYKWDNLNLYTPKNFKIKGYSVALIDEIYKSEVKISLNSVNIKTDAKEAITQVIEKFV